MTLEEQNLLRIKAWDRFSSAKTMLVAVEAKVRAWSEPFNAVGQACEFTPLDIDAAHYATIPSKADFEKAANEASEAGKAYQSARKEAAAFGFPVGDDDSAAVVVGRRARIAR